MIEWLMLSMMQICKIALVRPLATAGWKGIDTMALCDYRGFGYYHFVFSCFPKFQSA
jgi:hypothetical protein